MHIVSLGWFYTLYVFYNNNYDHFLYSIQFKAKLLLSSKSSVKLTTQVLRAANLE